MHLTRRMRLIWHKLWLIPLVGATADVVASEAAKLGGVTVPIPWLFSAIGVAGMLGAAVVRAYSVPLIPDGLETPDEALTRRSRVLGERLGATPVRVFVSDLPKLRGKVDTFLDGHDLFVSERVAELPEAERDFVLARALVPRTMAGRSQQRKLFAALVFAASSFVILASVVSVGWVLKWNMTFLHIWAALAFTPGWLLDLIERKLHGPAEERTHEVLALRCTGNLPASIAAVAALADTAEQRRQAENSAAALRDWWNAKGQKAVEASEWYQRERGLAAKAE